MKKKAYSFIFIAYVLLGLTGFLKFSLYAYFEQDSWHIVLNKYLLAKFFSGIITGLFFFWLYVKWMPEAFAKRKDKVWFQIIAPIYYCVIGFLLNTGIFFHADFFFGNAGTLHINGIVMNKNFRYKAKGGKEYFVSISDTATKLNYYFEVRRKVYDDAERGDVVNKDFSISKLGVIYRKNE